MTTLADQVIESINAAISRYDEIVWRIGELADQEEEISQITDYWDLRAVNFLATDLSIRILPNSIELTYEHWSFGADFSRQWELPMEMLELTDDEIKPWVLKKVAEGREETRQSNWREIQQLKSQLRRLEESM